MRTVKIGLLVALILLVLVPLVVWNQLAVDFNVTNNSSLANFKVSKLLGNVFLWRVGYLDTVDTINITYTDEVQHVFHVHSQDELTVSMGGNKTDQTINLILQYSPTHFPEIKDLPGWFDMDALVGICIMQEGDTLGIDGCYSKADNYLKWTKIYGLSRLVKISNGLLSSLNSILVKPALAQTCVGTIPCGTPTYNWVCRRGGSVLPGFSCNGPGSCGPQEAPGTCQIAGTGCQIAGGQTNNCGFLTSAGQQVCSTAGVNRCSPVGCNPSAEIFCSWVPPYNPPPYVPPPITPPSNPPPNPAQWFGCINNACSGTTWASQGACQAAGATNCQTGSCPACGGGGTEVSGCYNQDACAWKAFSSVAECQAAGAYACGTHGGACPSECMPRNYGNRFFYFFDDVNGNGNWDHPSPSELRILSGNNSALYNTYSVAEQTALGIPPASLQLSVSGVNFQNSTGIGNSENCGGGPETSCFNNTSQCHNGIGVACNMGLCQGDRNLKDGQIYYVNGRSGWHDAVMTIPSTWRLSPGAITKLFNSPTYSNVMTLENGSISFRIYIQAHNLNSLACSGIDGLGLERNYQKSCSISASSSSGAVSNSNGAINISNTDTLTVTGGAYSTAPYAEPSRLVVYKEDPGNSQSTVQINPLIPNTIYYNNSPNTPQHYYIFNTGLQVPNHNFESGSTVGWMGVGVDNFVVTSNTAYSGTRSLVARPILGSPDIYVASDFINTGIAVGNQTYTLQFAMRSHNNNVTVNNIGLQSNSWNYRSIGAISLTPQWQFFERQVTFPAGLSDTQIRAVFRTPSVSPAQQIYIDNVKILRSNTGYDCSTGMGSSCTGHAQMSNLSPGTYKFWCDLPTASGPHPQTCSGNPMCSVNGGHLSCTWPSCSNNDVVTVTVTCATQCGGGCGTADLGPPTTTITAPTAGDNLIAAQGSPLNITWQETTAGLADSYDIRIFNRAALPDPDQTSLSNLDCGDNVLCFNGREGLSYTYYPNANSYSGAVIAATGDAIGDQITVAVRGRNTTCGDQPGAWVWRAVNLTGNIPTEARVVETPGSCSPMNSTPANFNGRAQTYTATSNRSGYGAQTQTSSNNNYTLSNLRYMGSNWSPRYQLGLTLNNDPSDPTNTYVCTNDCRTALSDDVCSPVTSTNDYLAPPTAATSPARFYLLRYNLSNQAWFQWANGVAFGGNSYTSRVANACSSPNCTPRMSIALSEPHLGRAGIPLGGGSISHGSNPGTGYSERPVIGPYTGQRAQQQDFSEVTRKDYHYYRSIINFESWNSMGSGSSHTINNFNNFLDNSNWQDLSDTEVGEVANTVRAIYRNGDLIINASNVSGEGDWEVISGQKLIVFVNGDLTIRGRPGARVMTVASGGYLSFIVSGNITFENSVGYPVSESTRPENFRNPDQTNVEGIFNASNIIIAGGSSSTTSDRKFLGAGTFVGWDGIQLQRSFDDGNVGRALHNNSPTELFFYRPEFLLDTPRVLRETGLLWQQVN